MKYLTFGTIIWLLTGPAPALALDEAVLRASAGTDNSASASFTGRWLRRDNWFVEAELGYRSERHAVVSGVSILTGAIGRYVDLADSGQAFYWRWGIGLGVPHAGAATLTARRYASTEIRLLAAAGIVQPLGHHWRADFSVQYERSFIDRRLLDAAGDLLERQTGLSGAGLAFAVSYRF